MLWNVAKSKNLIFYFATLLTQCGYISTYGRQRDNSSLNVSTPHRTISDQPISNPQPSTARVPTPYPGQRLNVGLLEVESLKKTKEDVDHLLHYITNSE